MACGNDANGNMVKRKRNGSWQTLAYDHENRLTSVSGPLTATFTYDAEGRRVIGVVGGAETIYLWARPKSIL